MRALPPHTSVLIFSMIQIRITGNLEKAKRQLRFEDCKRLVWIYVEKSGQVRQFGNNIIWIILPLKLKPWDNICIIIKVIYPEQSEFNKTLSIDIRCFPSLNNFSPDHVNFFGVSPHKEPQTLRSFSHQSVWPHFKLQPTSTASSTLLSNFSRLC